MKKHIAVGLIILSCLGLIYFADIFLNPNSIADLGWNWYLDSEWYKMDSWLITDVVDLVLKVPFYAPLALLAIWYKKRLNCESNEYSLCDKILRGMFWLYVLIIITIFICGLIQAYKTSIR